MVERKVGGDTAILARKLVAQEQGAFLNGRIDHRGAIGLRREAQPRRERDRKLFQPASGAS